MILFLAGIAAGVIGAFFSLGALLIALFLFFVLKVPIPYAVGTALMCVVAVSSMQRSMVGVAAVAATLVFYWLGDLRPVITATALLGVILGAGVVRLFRKGAQSSMALRLTVAVSWCLFLIGVLADAVDPIAFGIIKPEHIPLLPGALIHGRPAAMMHIGILILLVTPVVRLVYSYSGESVH